jgi:calpain-15
MIDLMGAPYTSIRFEDEDVQDMITDGRLWETIKMYDSMGHIQTASTPGEDTLTEGGERRAKDNTTGLVAGHAYALLRARETSAGDRLVEIRNPWGQGGMEWSGDWSDKSPLWTPALIVSHLYSRVCVFACLSMCVCVCVRRCA